MQESNSRGGARPGAGRPRRPRTLAGALREAFPTEKLVAMVKKLAASESEDVQRWAIQWLADRTEGKAPDKIEIGPPGSMADDLDDDAIADQLTLAELDELDRLDDAKAKILDHARARLDRAALPAGEDNVGS